MNEGNTAELIIELTGESDLDVTVTMSTQDAEAVGMST